MSTVFGGNSEYLFRPASLDFFRREEAGKVVTDNLIRAVTFGLFGTDIPTYHLAHRVHHKDGVVLDSVEKHPISVFALSQGVLYILTSAFELYQTLFRILELADIA